MKQLLPLSLLAVLPLLGGCQSVYYGTLEKFGVHKREILVDRVEEAKHAQEDAKQQFEDALAAFISVAEVEPPEMEYAFRRLRSEYNSSENRANEVRERIEKIEDVAQALFDEWRDELAQYSSDSLRRSSERQLESTQRHAQQLIASMKQVAAKMDPVLAAFQDQVLFLKHNLNAQAVASLDQTASALRRDVGALIRDMEESIREAESFIDQMRSSSQGS